MPTSDTTGEPCEEPPLVPFLTGDLDRAAPDGLRPSYLYASVPERRFQRIELPSISARTAMRSIAAFIGAAALAVLIAPIVLTLLYALLPGAGIVILSLPVRSLRLANEVAFVVVAGAITMRYARTGAVRRPPVYFLLILFEINFAFVLDTLLT